MKLLIINPNTSDEMTSNIDSIAKKYARKKRKLLRFIQEKARFQLNLNLRRQ